jgi:hypothetical protein
MFYDSYKMGFSYYSDTQYLSYNILNAIAMKYVIYFSCLDLYMDDQCGFSSPLNNIYKKKEETVKKQKTLSNQFVKYKNYNKNTELSQITELNLNRFLFLGKTSNFSYLQKISNPVIKIKSYIDYKKNGK